MHAVVFFSDLRAISPGAAEEEGRTSAEPAGRPHIIPEVYTANSGDQAQASIGSTKKLLASSSSNAESGADHRPDATDLNGFNPLPKKLATIVSGESAPATPSAEEMQNLETQVQGISRHA